MQGCNFLWVPPPGTFAFNPDKVVRLQVKLNDFFEAVRACLLVVAEEDVNFLHTFRFLEVCYRITIQKGTFVCGRS
jgi:hypothetical protein